MATAAYGARNWSGAGSDAPAETTVVYSMAPCFSRMSTTFATDDSFWPIAQ